MSNLCPSYCFWGEILERPLLSSFMSSNIQGKYKRIYTSLLLQFIFISIRSCFQIKCTSVFISTEEKPFLYSKDVYIYIDHVLYIYMSKIYQSNVWLHPFLTVLRFKTTSWGSFFGGPFGSHSKNRAHWGGGLPGDAFGTTKCQGLCQAGLDLGAVGCGPCLGGVGQLRQLETLRWRTIGKSDKNEWLGTIPDANRTWRILSIC